MSDIAKLTIIKTEENKRTKIPNFDENSKRKSQMTMSGSNTSNE